MEATGGVTPPVASRRRLRLAALALTIVAVGCGGSGSPSDPAPTTASLQGEPVGRAPFDVEGHRGARGLQPENTLQAFETALDLGVATLELDLHFTQDGALVIWHDPIVPAEKCRLDPTATVAAPDPAGSDENATAFANLTSAQLAAYLCDKNPDPSLHPDQQASGTLLAGSSYRIVTLDELFTFVADYSESDSKTAAQRAGAAKVRFNVETKRDPDRPETINDGFNGTTPGPFETALLAVLADYQLADRVIVQSFDHRSLRAIHSVDPAIDLAALTVRNAPFSDDFASFATIWSPDYRSLSAGSLAAAHDAGLRVIPWTVNETTDMSRLIELGVDGLITDRPDILLGMIAGDA